MLVVRGLREILSLVQRDVLLHYYHNVLWYIIRYMESMYSSTIGMN